MRNRENVRPIASPKQIIERERSQPFTELTR